MVPSVATTVTVGPSAEGTASTTTPLASDAIPLIEAMAGGGTVGSEATTFSVARRSAMILLNSDRSVLGSSLLTGCSA